MGFPSDKEDAALRLLASCPRLSYLDLSALRGSVDGRLDLQALRAEAERLAKLESDSKSSGLKGPRIITIKAVPCADDSDQILYHGQILYHEQYEDEADYYYTDDYGSNDSASDQW